MEWKANIGTVALGYSPAHCSIRQSRKDAAFEQAYLVLILYCDYLQMLRMLLWLVFFVCPFSTIFCLDYAIWYLICV